MILAPSLLAADFGNLQQAIEMVNASEADWFHIDIMDGVFVPNISYGMPVLSVIQKHATKPLDVHLMIVDPDRYISTFAKLGSDILTVHYEACTHLHRTLQAIKAENMKAGVALNSCECTRRYYSRRRCALTDECKPRIWRSVVHRKYL